MKRHRTMGRSFRELVEDDLEIMPLMNLFVALIPMLLISAVFLNVTVIDMEGPSDELSGDPDQKTSEPLHLAVTIRENHFVVEGNRLDKSVIDRRTGDPEAVLAETLAAVVAEYPDNREVMIISESRTRYEEIITVMDLSRAAGLPSASLLGAD
jgi:biopolymer transport protein ExbD